MKKITVKEYAALRGISSQAAQKAISKHGASCAGVKEVNKNGRFYEITLSGKKIPKGRAKEYLVV